MTATVRMAFLTTEARNAYIAATFPEREATEVPGLYELPNGDRLGVFCETVTLYEKATPDALEAATGDTRR